MYIGHITGSKFPKSKHLDLLAWYVNLYSCILLTLFNSYMVYFLFTVYWRISLIMRGVSTLQRLHNQRGPLKQNCPKSLQLPPSWQVWQTGLKMEWSLSFLRIINCHLHFNDTSNMESIFFHNFFTTVFCFMRL